jgi:hypothetical protein
MVGAKLWEFRTSDASTDPIYPPACALLVTEAECLVGNEVGYVQVFDHQGNYKRRYLLDSVRFFASEIFFFLMLHCTERSEMHCS